MTYNFKNTLVRKPGKSISKAISSMGLVPKYEIVIKEYYKQRELCYLKVHMTVTTTVITIM